MYRSFKLTDICILHSVSVINRMLCTHNMPCVLVQLIGRCPWSRCKDGKSYLYFRIKRVLARVCDSWPTGDPPSNGALSPTEGEVEKYVNGRWQRIPVEDHLKMTKLDGQVWISLYNLLLKEDCQRKYDFNNFNKNQLLKVYCG